MNEGIQGAPAPMANTASLEKSEKVSARRYGLIGGDDPLGALNLERMITSAVQVGERIIARMLCLGRVSVWRWVRTCGGMKVCVIGVEAQNEESIMILSV